MTEHSESRVVPYTADLMYAVVADVERYPEFLPWVVALRVKSRAGEAGREILMAEMAVGYRAFRERYTSKVTLDGAARVIDVVAVEGPFHRLENHWRFTPEGDSARVDFRVAFEFSSRLLQLAAGQAFAKVLLKLADAFEARAGDLSRRQGLVVESAKYPGRWADEGFVVGRGTCLAGVRKRRPGLDQHSVRRKQFHLWRARGGKTLPRRRSA